MSKNKKAEYPEFYCCYLLRSLQSKHRNYVYIGTTPNPIQRLRQHNGEIAAGAHKTEKKRPWEMLLLVHGFPTNTAALQFEWAWTYDHYSRHFPGRLTNQKTSLKSRLDVLHEMLRLDVWNRWPLALHLVAADSNLINTDMLPKHIKVTSGPLQTMRYTFADKGRAESK
ncbi:8780_t:CDS:2 [Paraglomus occultum]|uniref:8780_t:CDS:1 n=1 Tax=Paraglomus occultum TaxID=144539 RepID=A0A9N9AB53_9GLOM|nr:8780_t:CDS:2 [Paraglomus occultum]